MQTPAPTIDTEWKERWRWELMRSLAEFMHAPSDVVHQRLLALVDAYAREHVQRRGTEQSTFFDYHVGA